MNRLRWQIALAALFLLVVYAVWNRSPQLRLESRTHGYDFVDEHGDILATAPTLVDLGSMLDTPAVKSKLADSRLSVQFYHVSRRYKGFQVSDGITCDEIVTKFGKCILREDLVFVLVLKSKRHQSLPARCNLKVSSITLKSKRVSSTPKSSGLTAKTKPSGLPLSPMHAASRCAVGVGRSGQAVRILDRFHVMKKFNEKINAVRAAEAKAMKADGYEPVLKNSRWALLKRPENLTDKQTVKLKELLQYNLRSVRAYLMREDFQRFWGYRSPSWAGKFLDEWCARAMRSQLAPMKEMARTLGNHRALLLNWFSAGGELLSGSVEGLNAKAKLAMKKAYGFKSYETIEIALYHQLGKLPEPKITHTFC